jgi:hypothetical protein
MKKLPALVREESLREHQSSRLAPRAGAAVPLLEEYCQNSHADLVSAALAAVYACLCCLSRRRHRRSVIVSFHRLWFWIYLCLEKKWEEMATVALVPIIVVVVVIIVSTSASSC